jgi:hypothetical protein
MVQCEWVPQFDRESQTPVSNGRWVIDTTTSGRVIERNTETRVQLPELLGIDAVEQAST